MSSDDYSEYLQNLKETLIIDGSSENTIKLYVKQVENFLQFAKKDVHDLNEKDVRRYLLYLDGKKLSNSTINTYLASIRYFFATTLERTMNYLQIPRKKRIKRNPVVLTRDEIDSLIEHADNCKYSAMFALAYGSGLRLSELLAAQVTDIDSKNMKFHVRLSKGNKDRETVLSMQSLKLLRKYWLQYKPTNTDNLLFPGNCPNGQMSESAVDTAFKRALKAAKIKKQNATFHSLRHSFATQLYEDGYDILTIKDLMGHSSIYSTTVYLHTANIKRNAVISPADRNRD